MQTKELKAWLKMNGAEQQSFKIDLEMNSDNSITIRSAAFTERILQMGDTLVLTFDDIYVVPNLINITEKHT